MLTQRDPDDPHMSTEGHFVAMRLESFKKSHILSELDDELRDQIDMVEVCGFELLLIWG